jgi:hypothetical protein
LVEIIQLVQEQQKNMMATVGQHTYKFKYSKIIFSRCRYTNSSFSIWWLQAPALTAATEEYTGAGPATKTITVS